MGHFHFSAGKGGVLAEETDCPVGICMGTFKIKNCDLKLWKGQKGTQRGPEGGGSWRGTTLWQRETGHEGTQSRTGATPIPSLGPHQRHQAGGETQQEELARRTVFLHWQRRNAERVQLQGPQPGKAGRTQG